MCLILDADRFSQFLDPGNRDMKPVRDWINKQNGKIVYAPTERLQEELEWHKPMKKRFSEYRQAGRIKIFDKERVNEEENKLTDLLSNDSHVIALAIVSGVKLLVGGDKNLQKDFKKKIGGKIYKKRNHKHLLQHDTCP